MKVLEIRWVAFMHDLNGWMSLPEPAREILAQPKDPDRLVLEYDLQQHHDVLIETEFLRRLASGRVALKKECKPFLRIIRALKTNTALEKPSAEVFISYLANYLTHPERNALWGRPGHWPNDDELFRDIAALQWLNDFLVADGPDWEERYHRSFVPPYFEDPETLAIGQRLVKDCIERKAPIALRELPDLYGGLDSDMVDLALTGCIRYLLLFPWLRSGDDEPVFGIWPGIVKRLDTKPPKPPRAVEPDDVFHSPLRIGDMTSLLVAAAAEPLRLRVSDSYLFAKTQKSLRESLLRLPDWLPIDQNIDTDIRIRGAFGAVRSFGFIRDAEEPGDNLCAEITEQGREWLALSAKERVRRVLDNVKAATASLSGGRRHVEEAETWLPVDIQFYGKGNPAADVRKAIRRQFSAIPTETYWKWSDFRHYYAVNNDIAERARKGDRLEGYLGGRYFYRLTPEDIEHVWPPFLDRILLLDLFPLGAIKIGHAGGELCVSLTGLGQYLFGLADDFEFEEASGGGILVQPNFEVAFLAPNPAAEADIGRFAERKGHNVGILFVITKASVMRAGAGGLTATLALETLERFATKKIPPNVRREIEGWFGACRRISVHPALLIHCPDPETATLVLAVARDKAERLTDTVVELRNPAWRAPLLRKLRAMGIFT